MAQTILTGNPELIRDINTQSVIQTILENGSISRAAIAARLGLTKATVSAIVQTLLDRGLVLETGSENRGKSENVIQTPGTEITGTSKITGTKSQGAGQTAGTKSQGADQTAGTKSPGAGQTAGTKGQGASQTTKAKIAVTDKNKKGRRAILLELNRRCGYIISLDLGAERMTLMTADLLGGNCRIYRYETPQQSKDLPPALSEHIRTAMEEHRDGRYGLLGIALSIHGVVHHNRIIFLPYASYAGLDLAGILSKTFGVPVYLENEANLSVLGEWYFCHRTNEMLYISIHTGIGVGIIMRDQLVKGKNGYAGEFGHTIIEVNGRPCPCGNRGCLEQYASERALFAELSHIKGVPVDADLFEQLYRRADPDAHRLMEQFITYMSVGINNLLHTFNPDIIVLNSVLIRCRPSLCEDITQRLHNKMNQYCRLIPSTLQDTSALLGGIYLVQDKFLTGRGWQ